MRKPKLQDIQNSLDTFKKECPELKDCFFYHAETGNAKSVALAEKRDLGTISTKTEFLTYGEMHQFLRGYYFKSINKFEPKTINI